MLKVILSKYPLLLVMAAGVLAFIAVLAFTGGAVRASERDDRIESSFKKSYVYNTYLKGEDIQISCKDGAVTLSGAVADESHKPMAQGVAGALPGVTSVDNQITVKGERPAQSSDTWISIRVKAALLYRRNVSGTTRRKVDQSTTASHIAFESRLQLLVSGAKGDGNDRDPVTLSAAL